ncbi:Hypothetical_protein [Hexamita inflata]|uniref:Hypothetical_protein n=1 Tax=Hexamita inflata TaxID=28002 RepID=A0AA86PJP8_9EUKA|nr:Hypothetical protein HINF_LOCUS28685 [Hexamita inflata]
MSILVLLIWLLNSKFEVVSAFELYQLGTSRRECQFTAVQAREQIDTFKKWSVSFSHQWKSFFRPRLLYLELQRFNFDSNFPYYITLLVREMLFRLQGCKSTHLQGSSIMQNSLISK